MAPAAGSSIMFSPMTTLEAEPAQHFIGKLCGLKYEHWPEIRDRAVLERNFPEELIDRIQLDAKLVDERYKIDAPERIILGE